MLKLIKLFGEVTPESARRFGFAVGYDGQAQSSLRLRRIPGLNIGKPIIQLEESEWDKVLIDFDPAYCINRWPL